MGRGDWPSTCAGRTHSPGAAAGVRFLQSQLQFCQRARETIVDQNQPDEHIADREAEKLADLEALADALAAFRQLRRPLDQWERVHLARGLAAVFSGCYGTGASEAALALMPIEERSPSAKVPADPFYQRLDLALFERALSEVWAEPARRVPYFGSIEGA